MFFKDPFEIYISKRKTAANTSSFGIVFKYNEGYNIPKNGIFEPSGLDRFVATATYNDGKKKSKYTANIPLTDVDSFYEGYQKMLMAEAVMSVSDTAKSPGSMTIYNSGPKFISSIQNSKGNCLIYEIELLYDFKKRYPGTFVIKNYYAPVTSTAAGGRNILFNKKEDIDTFRLSIDKNDVRKIVCLMKEMKANYTSYRFKDKIAEAEHRRKENYNKNKEEGNDA